MSLRSRLVLAVRALLVAAGLFVALGLGYELATLPPEPPNSDGFIRGGVYLWGSLIILAALFVAGLGVVLPSLFGRDDPLFSAGQRTALKYTGWLFLAGLVGWFVVWIAVDFLIGALVFLLAVVLGMGIIVTVVAWRALEALVAVTKGTA